MDSHLEAAHALKHMLQQASVEPSEHPSQSEWASLFDAHVINLENHTIILDKVLSLGYIAEPIRKEIEAMRIMAEHSRQGALGLKGLLVLHTSGILGLSELISPTKLSTSPSRAPEQTGPSPRPFPPDQTSSSSTPFNARIKIWNLPENCTTETLEDLFQGYQPSNLRLLRDSNNCRYAVLTVPSGRMQLLACNEMNGRTYGDQRMLVQPFDELVENWAAVTAKQNINHDRPTLSKTGLNGIPVKNGPVAPNQPFAHSGKEKRKSEQDTSTALEPRTKRVLRANGSSIHRPENLQPVEYEDITDEVQRRLKEKEKQREREKEQKMNPAGRKRMRESFESADFLLEAESSHNAKRFRDLTVSPEPVPDSKAPSGSDETHTSEAVK